MEIFAARGSNTYLANISCNKPGPVFPTISESCSIHLVYWDYEKNQPFLATAGNLCPVPDGSVGMLLSEINTNSEHHGEQPIYNAFEKDDCWQSSRDFLWSMKMQSIALWIWPKI